ncbi:hypothetical protein ATANTOWER_001830 [Ataeniobius toweri]|uniref:Uncharacterized protein n=1 Tax=Ataeniobius toweri TaxID=208326 RepID=A0ABU7A3T5_9TELE|nr:hypothetical protein [Ataeniobius toweri]
MRRKIHERSSWNRKARNFTLPNEDVNSTRDQKPHGGFKETELPSLFLFQSTVDGPSCSFLPKEAKDDADHFLELIAEAQQLPHSLSFLPSAPEETTPSSSVLFLFLLK